MIGRHCVAASAVLPLITALIWPTRWTCLLLVAWLCAVAVYWILDERKRHKQQLDSTLKAARLRAIKTLNHHRHDWMNEIQVVFGYVRLNRMDKAIASLEKISKRALAESKIAHLGSPILVEFLQSFSSTSNVLTLSVEVGEGVHLQEWDETGERLSEALVQLILAYRSEAALLSTGESVLVVKLTNTENGLQIQMQLDGEMSEAGSRVRQEVAKLQEQSLFVVKMTDQVIRLSVDRTS